MTNLYYLPLGEDAPETVDVVIEVPRGSANKYEYDPDHGVFRLDRVLYSPMHYPGDYGFLPSTLAEDGDPLDAVVLTSIPTYPGTVLRARPLAYLEMSDEKGRDQKILAVPVDDPRYDDHRNVSSISGHLLREIEHFFAIYKELEGKKTLVEDWHGIEDCHRIIEDARRAFRRAYLEPEEAVAPASR